MVVVAMMMMANADNKIVKKRIFGFIIIVCWSIFVEKGKNFLCTVERHWFVLQESVVSNIVSFLLRS